MAFRELIREVPIADHVRALASTIIMATHPQWEHAPEPARRFVRYGASPRGAQALVLGAKVRALTEGRFNVSVGRPAGAGRARAAPSDHPELRGRGRGHRHRRRSSRRSSQSAEAVTVQGKEAFVR